MEKTIMILAMSIIQAVTGALAVVALLIACAVGAIDAAHAADVCGFILQTIGFMLTITAAAAAVTYLVEKE